jgi:hypothetical protein
LGIRTTLGQEPWCDICAINEQKEMGIIFHVKEKCQELRKDIDSLREEFISRLPIGEERLLGSCRF